MNEDSGGNWQSISDMMSALMMIFLFISVLYMLQTQVDKTKITEVAEAYKEMQEDLHTNLQEEFEKDLERWDASLEDDNTIRFYAPEVLFDSGSSEIGIEFEVILKNFFPRYLKLLLSDKYKHNVDEMRIEGHTSSEWGPSSSFEKRYLANLSLSQQRSFEVLKYCFSILENNDEKEWLKGVFRANGLSFAKLILNEDGTEDSIKSRRVEFKVIMKTEERIQEILDLANE